MENLPTIDDLIDPEMQERLELLEKHAAYLEGYSDGIWWGYRGKQLVGIVISIAIFLGWIAAVLYTLSLGC